MMKFSIAIWQTDEFGSHSNVSAPTFRPDFVSKCVHKIWFNATCTELNNDMGSKKKMVKFSEENLTWQHENGRWQGNSYVHQMTTKFIPWISIFWSPATQQQMAKHGLQFLWRGKWTIAPLNSVGLCNLNWGANCVMPNSAHDSEYPSSKLFKNNTSPNVPIPSLDLK